LIGFGLGSVGVALALVALSISSPSTAVAQGGKRKKSQTDRHSLGADGGINARDRHILKVANGTSLP
jgi:hypothetical protein